MSGKQTIITTKTVKLGPMFIQISVVSIPISWDSWNGASDISLLNIKSGIFTELLKCLIDLQKSEEVGVKDPLLKVKK